MEENAFTRAELRELLLAVGLDPTLDARLHRMSFEDLGLDSLARVELASRIRDGHGVDLEERLGPELTPEDVERLVNEELSRAA